MKKALLCFGVFLLFMTPPFSYAQGSGPTFICVRIAPSPPVALGGRPPGTVPCFENSPCGPVPGLCMHNGFGCKAITPPSCAGNKGVLDKGLQGLQQLINQALMALMGGMMGGGMGGGGGGGGGMGGGMMGGMMPFTPSSLFNEQANNTPQNLLEDLINKANEPTIDFEEEEEEEEPKTTIASDGNLLLVSDDGTETVLEGGAAEDQNLEPEEEGTQVETASFRGSSFTILRSILPKRTEPARVESSDDGATLTSSTVDEETNTGVGSFFGGGTNAGAQEDGLVARLCTNRPWENSFVSFIFSSAFFNNLCENRGYGGGFSTAGQTDNSGVGESQTNTEGRIELMCPRQVTLGAAAEIKWSCGASVRSGGIGFETNGWPTGTRRVFPEEDATYTLECAQGGSVSCTVRVVGPEVEIVAHPQLVALGARTRVYWIGTNVERCEVTGPGFEEEGIRGAATTGSILDKTTFTVTCTSRDGAVVSNETVVDVGL